MNKIVLEFDSILSPLLIYACLVVIMKMNNTYDIFRVITHVALINAIQPLL